LGLALLLLPPFARASEREEHALWQLWQAETAATQDPATALEACRRAGAELTNSALGTVAAAIEVWHVLGTGGLAAARAPLEKMQTASGTPLATAAADFARRWLTRLDRERVAAALHEHYLKHVGYPESLEVFDALPADRRPPLEDRWKVPWRYRLASFRHVSGLTDQRFVLESTRLGKASALGPMLKPPHPARPPLAPRQVRPSASGSAAIVFETTGDEPEKVVLSQGGTHGSITLAYVGARILVLCDGDFWYVLPMPGE
jgi:hypothetical protein